ncbi:class I SAM-dependent methyltransferase [Comamonas sp. Z3]|uniref:class I SAM-dependent methyltransferase n=1 Tax=Comamonas sp. Z3 TaxID=2601247 RepID=UPI0011E7C2C7|nr:class I SAM-dependent methyltransferase [Comamonas sp. Z3]TYK71853.1 class I SAM-dependent methyltransferase [Comamonas sp. Z3]
MKKTEKNKPNKSYSLKDIQNFQQRSDITKLLKAGSIGVELGVAEGRFSETLLKTGCFSHLYSIDMWAGDRHHDTAQYKTALRRLLPFRDRNTTLRMTFDEALDLFPDAFFDFIYVDGYAHTGEEGGATFDHWWPKLKPGGVMAGDDYAPKWPLVVQAVDAFIDKYQLEIGLLNFQKSDDPWSQYPTWATVKPIEK